MLTVICIDYLLKFNLHYNLEHIIEYVHKSLTYAQHFNEC